MKHALTFILAVSLSAGISWAGRESLRKQMGEALFRLGYLSGSADAGHDEELKKLRVRCADLERRQAETEAREGVCQ